MLLDIKENQCLQSNNKLWCFLNQLSEKTLLTSSSVPTAGKDTIPILY